PGGLHKATHIYNASKSDIYKHGCLPQCRLGIVATTVTATGQVSYGQGLCARVGTDPSFRKCYVPSIINSTCMELAGPACAQYGGETSFDEPIGCCNRLVSMLATVSIVRAYAPEEELRPPASP
ncbi:uncharacterized protein HaLaN_17367, partial [Haematococcus lacustris]